MGTGTNIFLTMSIWKLKDFTEARLKDENLELRSDTLKWADTYDVFIS